MIVDVQKTLIGSCIDSNERINLLSADLFDGSFKELFEVLVAIYRREGLVSYAIVEHSLANSNKKLLAILNSISAYKPTMTFEEANIIAVKEHNRRIFKHLITNDVSDDIELYRVIEGALSKFKRVNSFVLSNHIDKAIDRLLSERASKYPIGVSGIDEVIDISPDRFITIGGASGSGKTAFTIFLIDKLCALYGDSIDVLFISLEMSEERVINRLLSLHSGLHSKELRKRAKTDASVMDMILDFRSKVSSYPLEILYTDMDVNKIDLILQSHIHKANSRNRTPILFLDHFGEVAGLEEHSAKSNTDRITMSVKNYVKRGGIGFGLTQLRKDLKDKRNRETYYRPSNTYIMNSQSVEARSDMILHLWRPEQDGFADIVYEDMGVIYSIDCRDSVCLVNDKNRDNEKKDIWLDCNIAINHFKDITNNKIKVIEKGL